MSFVSKENLQSILSTFKTKVSAEIDSAVAGLNPVSVQVVSTLPTENISTTTIYLTPAASATAGNLYDEHMYVNGAWESFGSVSVDLTGYDTSEQVDTKISDAVSAAAPVAMTTEDITAFNATLWP